MATATPIGPQHVGVLEPNVESILSPDHIPVSVTAHGIAAVREIEVKSDIYNGNQMQFNRLFSPSDLIDRTWLLSFPVEVEYEALEGEDDFHLTGDIEQRHPWGGVVYNPSDLTTKPTLWGTAAKRNPSGHGTPTANTAVFSAAKVDVLRNMMMAKKLGVADDLGDVKLAPNAFSRMVTHCVLTLNNGTLSSQPYMENLPKAYYTDPDEVQANDGLNRPFTSTIPYLAGEGLTSISTEQSNALQNHTIGSYPMQKEDGTQPTGLTAKVEVTCTSAEGATTIRSYGAEELLCQKTVNGENIAYALQDLGMYQKLDANLSSFFDDFSMTGFAVTKIKVTYNITVPIDHPLLQNAAGDECLCNVRNMDLKIGYKDLLKSLYLPRQVDFRLGGKTYKGYPSFNAVKDLGPVATMKANPGLGGYDATTNTHITVEKDDGTATADATLQNIPWGLKDTDLNVKEGVAYPWTKAPGNVNWTGTTSPTNIRSPFSGFQVIPQNVIARVPENASASLRLRLYQSAVPVPRSISIPTNTYIVRQTSNSAPETKSISGLELSTKAQGLTKLRDVEQVGATPNSFGAQFTFQTDSYSLSEVPLKMYIFVAGQNLDGEQSTGVQVTGDLMSTPDKLLRITEANFRTTANTGTLSAATHRQLYEMCKRNGLNIPMEQFLYDGNVLCIRPSRDLGGWVEGSRETFTHDFKIVADIPGSTQASFNSLLARMRSTEPPSGAGPLALDCFSGGGTSDMRKLLANELACLRMAIKNPTLYVVYEMAGQTMLQADGQMMTTSGIDTSTIIGTLEGSGLTHSHEIGGAALSAGGGMGKYGMSLFRHVKNGGRHMVNTSVNSGFVQKALRNMGEFGRKQLAHAAHGVLGSLTGGDPYKPQP